MSATRSESASLDAAEYWPEAETRLAFVRDLVRQEPAGAVAVLILTLLIGAVLLGPLIWPYGPTDISIQESFVSPGFASGHWLGTDQLGRDVLSRLLAGGRVSLSTSFTAILIGIGGGALLGLVSGFVRGWLSQAIQRIIDGLMSVPPLILALAIATALGNSMINIAIAIAIVMVPTSARVIRGATLSERAADYVLAGITLGATGSRILTRYILPNVFGTILTIASVWIGAVIIIEASLGFVGIGVQPPQPSWGNMLSSEGRAYMTSAPWLAIVPGAAISVTVLAFNMLGDSLRSVLDPKSRGRL